jgi:hypothetical protein
MPTLKARIDALGISPPELAALVRRPLDEVENWLTTKQLGGEAAVLIRFLADPEDAHRRVEQLRRTVTRSLEGDGAAYSGIKNLPYGSNDAGKVTGEGWQ